MARSKNEILIMGGGLAGLAAGSVLTQAGLSVKVLEKGATVGGLSRTIVHGGFRFDLGGHRFFTKNKIIEEFLQNLMDGELLKLPRKSKILFRNKYVDYPLKPLNAISSMGVPMTLKAICDYALERIKRQYRVSNMVSLEDWIVSQFGRTMFNIYFKEYSEKVWGIECSKLSMEWVVQRIKGLSLGTAVRNAFFGSNGNAIATLADTFTYPSKGIGRISERLRGEIDKKNSVLLNVRVKWLCHDNFQIETAKAVNGHHSTTFEGSEVISSIPINNLVQMLDPKPPEDVLRAADKLKFRDMVIVAIMLNRERVTDQNWIYIPEQKIPFGRIHEPTNWSPQMAPEGKTLLVTEHFCFSGDATWCAVDEELADNTIWNLEKLKFIKREEVIDHVVIRVPKAYPLFEVGYRKHYDKICVYLSKFKNLHITGRGGMFKYHNMDQAIASGIEAAEKIIKRNSDFCVDYTKARVFAGANA
ncbi:MAG: FAD-dependent oxidoreductase [Desulfobacterales bacterium]